MIKQSILKFVNDRNFTNKLSIVGVLGCVISASLNTRTAIKKETPGNIKQSIFNTWSYYLPTVAIMLVTIYSISRTKELTELEKMSLISALTMSQKRYIETKEAIEKICDEDTLDDIRAEIIRNKIPKEKYLERTSEKCIYEEYSGKFFTTTLDNLLKAEYKFNKKLAVVGYASLNDLYKYIGIEETEEGLYLGWNIGEYDTLATPSTPLVNFIHNKCVDDDGMEYYFLGFENQPEANYDMF